MKKRKPSIQCQCPRMSQFIVLDSEENSGMELSRNKTELELVPDVPIMMENANFARSQSLIINEDTGEMQMVQFTDPSIANEVEVVAFENKKKLRTKNKRQQHQLLPMKQQISLQRHKTAPAMLRNSKKFLAQQNSSKNTPDTSGFSVPGSQNFKRETLSVLPATLGGGAQILLRGAIEIPQSLSQGDTGLTSFHLQDQQIIFIDDNIPEESRDNEDLTESSAVLLSANNEDSQSSAPTFILCEDSLNSGSGLPSYLDGSLDGSAKIICHVDEQGFITFSKDEPDLAKNFSKKEKKLKHSIVHNQQKAKKKGNAELKCLEKGCSVICYSVGDLRKHLTDSHDFIFDEEIVPFVNDAGEIPK